MNRIAAMVMSGFLALFCLPTGFAQDWQPVPVSEYAEKSGPNTLTFLSYPKYYKDAEQKLTLVKTNLVESGDPKWDYEVTTGIWTLRVRTDGTFQAEHQGDVFSYQLSGVGVGRGEAFKAFDWGTPVWKNYQIMGDAIRWSDVFPDVDLSVRYIHDILKVDVIVKAALMNQIRGEVQKGNLNAEDYLTARFDIPGVWVSSEARQAGEKVDLYTESLDVKQPLQFVKDGKVIHKLRPVETYVLDEKGEPIITFDEENIIRSAQTWRLKQDAVGAAEMSAHLGDLAKAPEGDVVIDPSLSFGDQTGDLGNAYDAILDELYPTTNYGSMDYLRIGAYGNYEFRSILGFSTQGNLDGRIITSANLRMNLYSIYGSPSDQTAKAYKVTNGWYESSVTWNGTGFGPSWTNTGGDHELTKYCSKTVTLPDSLVGDPDDWWVDFDVSYAFKSHFATDTDDTYDRGFLVKMDSVPTSNIVWTFLSSDYSGMTSRRPELVVEFGATEFGAHILPDDASADQAGRMERVADDYFEYVRYLDEVAIGWIPTFSTYASNEDLKVFIHSPVAGSSYDESPSVFNTHMDDLLDEGLSHIQNGTIFAAEIGGEEENKSFWWTNSFTPPNGYWYGSQINGASFAEYYLGCIDKLRDDYSQVEIISGGAAEKHESISFECNFFPLFMLPLLKV